MPPLWQSFLSVQAITNSAADLCCFSWLLSMLMLFVVVIVDLWRLTSGIATGFITSQNWPENPSLQAQVYLIWFYIYLIVNFIYRIKNIPILSLKYILFLLCIYYKFHDIFNTFIFSCLFNNNFDMIALIIFYYFTIRLISYF